MAQFYRAIITSGYEHASNLVFPPAKSRADAAGVPDHDNHDQTDEGGSFILFFVLATAPVALTQAPSATTAPDVAIHVVTYLDPMPNKADAERALLVQQTLMALCRHQRESCWSFELPDRENFCWRDGGSGTPSESKSHRFLTRRHHRIPSLARSSRLRRTHVLGGRTAGFAAERSAERTRRLEADRKRDLRHCLGSLAQFVFGFR